MKKKIISSNEGGKFVKEYTMEATITFRAKIKARNADSADSKFKDALMDTHLIAKPRTKWNTEFTIPDTISYQDAIKPSIVFVKDTNEINCTQVCNGK